MFAWVFRFLRHFLFDADEFERSYKPAVGRVLMGTLSVVAYWAGSHSEEIGALTSPLFGNLVFWGCAALVGGSGASGVEALRNAITRANVKPPPAP